MTIPDLTEPADQLLRQCVEFGPDVLMILGADGRCRHVSPASTSLLGRVPDELLGTHLRDLAVPADQPVVDGWLASLACGHNALTVFRAQCGFGIWTWVEASARRLPMGAGIVLSLRDVGVRKEEEALLIEANELLRRRATLDPVTCLPNRGHFIAALQRELRRVQREAQPLALLAVGIDDMRLFNDLYGRDAGDVALRETATAIKVALARPGDIAGRLKGPTIGVILPGTALAGTPPVVDRLRQAVGDLAVEHAGTPSGRLSVTIGIAVAEPRTKAEGLLHEATCEMEVGRAARFALA